ncbi:MAG: NUDIX hydrolase [Candidatus Nanohalobium sp.]
MAQKFVVVAANLIEKDDKYLLIQEGKEHVKGEWNLPAGSLEIGETPVEGAKREAKEETGLTVEPESLVKTYIPPESEDPNNIVNFVYHSQIQSGEVSIREEDTVIDYGWFTEQEIEDLDLRASYILAAIQDYKNGENYSKDSVRMIKEDLRT